MKNQWTQKKDTREKAEKRWKRQELKTNDDYFIGIDLSGEWSYDSAWDLDILYGKQDAEWDTAKYLSVNGMA